MDWHNPVIYEQPTNELMRLCLRYERLRNHVEHYLPGEHRYDSRAALNALLEIVTITDRSDLKSSLAKELSRHRANLSRLQQMPNVDHPFLNKILDDLDSHQHQLNTMTGKFTHVLRENDFLNSVRVQLANPGGACAINNPALNFWLQQKPMMRHTQLKAWLKEIDHLHALVHFLLQLVRDSNIPKLEKANQGFFETALDPKHPIQMMRIQLPEASDVYPEISIGKHRMCIRFLQTGFTERAQQINFDVGFKLTCCII